jgi:hypothetical protein
MKLIGNTLSLGGGRRLLVIDAGFELGVVHSGFGLALLSGIAFEKGVRAHRDSDWAIV